MDFYQSFNKIMKINYFHSLIFFNLSIFISAFEYLRNNNFLIICLFLILSIGISHGSLDNLKGKKILKIFELDNIYIFYLSYISIALIVIILWIIMPAISLTVFLIVASFHFGKEDTQVFVAKNSYYHQLLFFLKGLLIILAPMYFHFDETISIFKLLLVDNENFYETLNFIEMNKILLLGIILSTLSNILLFVEKFELKKFTIFLDYFSILIINYYFSPLVAFTIYFCFLHSVRHGITLIFELDQNNLMNGLKIFIKKAIPLTILTAIFCLIGLYLLQNIYDLNSSILKTIFISLASLTFPHILLEYLLEKNEK